MFFRRALIFPVFNHLAYPLAVGVSHSLAVRLNCSGQASGVQTPSSLASTLPTYKTWTSVGCQR
jgi:hypothetical protein